MSPRLDCSIMVPMKTIIKKINNIQSDRDIIEEAGKILKKGGLVAFPTETVYGLGADALNEQAAEKIYAAKGRPSDNPLIVHIAGMEDLPRIAEIIPEEAKIVAEKDWQALPAHMREAAKEASETFLHTSDGQLCDIIVDRAALAAIYECGKNASDAIIRDYAETTVAVADIKIAVRSQKTGKHLDFMRRAMAPCDSLNIERLSQAALGGAGAICEYLEGTRYAGGAQALKESPSAFERWCDNQLIETIKPQKYNPFTAGPLVAYVLAKENEIKTVRIILTARLNGLEEEQIRERIREMYV